jgi:tetratricopeptide (TPR) repeat protein
MLLRSVALAVVTVAGGAILAAQTPGTPGGATRVLVLPFENTGSDAHLRWLGEASAVLVADGLKARGVAAIGRDERVRAFEELHLPASATLSRATVIKLAELLGARELVSGTFSVQDRELAIQAHVIRVDAGRVRAPSSQKGQLTDLFDLHERLVRDLSPETSSPAAPTARPPLGAFEYYVKGLIAATPAARASFLETAIQDYPAFDRARLALWDVRTDQGDHAAALAAVRPVASSSPQSGRARFYAATSMLNLQRYDEAFDAYKELESGAGPAAIDAQLRGAVNNNMGVIQIRRSTSQQSGTPVYFLTKATEADPGASDAFFNLGYAYALDRNYQAAIYWLRELLRRNPADPDAHVVLAFALQNSGSTVEAGRERELARQLAAHREDTARVGDRQGLPRALERVQIDPQGSGSMRASAIIGLSAQREQREQAAFHLERGRRLADRGQDVEALGELRRAVYLSPYEAQAHLLIGRILLREGRAREALDALKISIWSADSAPAHVALAEVYLKTGDPKTARTEAERALTMDPASADAKRVLAQIK